MFGLGLNMCREFIVLIISKVELMLQFSAFERKFGLFILINWIILTSVVLPMKRTWIYTGFLKIATCIKTNWVGVWSYLLIKLNDHFKNRQYKMLWITILDLNTETANINLHFVFQYNYYKLSNMPMDLTK
jgi:hypothetical protein